MAEFGMFIRKFYVIYLINRSHSRILKNILRRRRYASVNLPAA